MHLQGEGRVGVEAEGDGGEEGGGQALGGAAELVAALAEAVGRGGQLQGETLDQQRQDGRQQRVQAALVEGKKRRQGSEGEAHGKTGSSNGSTRNRIMPTDDGDRVGRTLQE